MNIYYYLIGGSGIIASIAVTAYIFRNNINKYYVKYKIENNQNQENNYRLLKRSQGYIDIENNGQVIYLLTPFYIRDFPEKFQLTNHDDDDNVISVIANDNIQITEKYREFIAHRFWIHYYDYFKNNYNLTIKSPTIKDFIDFIDSDNNIETLTFVKNDFTKIEINVSDNENESVDSILFN